MNLIIERENNTWSVVVSSTNKKSRFHIASLFHFSIERKRFLDIFLRIRCTQSAKNNWEEVSADRCRRTGAGWMTALATSGREHARAEGRSRRLVGRRLVGRCQAAPPLQAPGVISLQPQYFHLTGETRLYLSEIWQRYGQ